MFNREANSRQPKCAACNSPAYWTVWEISLCVGCHFEWLRDDAQGVEAINKSLGISDKIEDFTPMNSSRYEIEAKRRTGVWVASRAQRSAA